MYNMYSFLLYIKCHYYSDRFNIIHVIVFYCINLTTGADNLSEIIVMKIHKFLLCHVLYQSCK